jgi:hypothetical protein
MRRRLLYTTRHHHGRILDSLKSRLFLDSLHDFTLKILQWYKPCDPVNFGSGFSETFVQGGGRILSGAGLAARHEVSGIG